MNKLTIREILNFLKASDIWYEFWGDESTELVGFSSLKNYRPNTFTWIKKQEMIDSLNTERIALAFVSDTVKGEFVNGIRTKESKRAFFSTIEHFFPTEDNKKPIGTFTYVGEDVKIGKNVRIGNNCTLDGAITIEDNVRIWNNVSIVNKVHIGAWTEIQSGSVIGHDGFGYSETENHKKVMVRHYGGVRIGRHVLISSNVCIARGTIDDTVIEDGVKIDNLSHIAHNCFIGEDSALAFPCFLGGSSHVEKNGYIAGGIIRNQCVVKEDGFVGMGAVVTKDVPAGTVVIGNPARPYQKNK